MKALFFLLMLFKTFSSYSEKLQPPCEDNVIFEKEVICFKDDGDFLLNFKIIDDKLLIQGHRPIIFSIDWSYQTNYSTIVENYQFFKGFDNIYEITLFIIESIKKNDYFLLEKNGNIELTIDFKVIPKKFRIILAKNEIKDVDLILKNIDTHLVNNYQNSYFASSSILYTNEMYLIRKWINSNNDFSLKLLYKATDHGFSSSNLYQKVNNVPTTLILIKSHLDFRFGGVYFKDFNNLRSRGPHYDEQSFAFSLNRKFKLPNIQDQNNYYGYDYMINFNNAFYIYDNPETNFNSLSDLNDQQMKNYEKEINPTSFLAGSRSFLVKEIEIYQINLD